MKDFLFVKQGDLVEAAHAIFQLMDGHGGKKGYTGPKGPKTERHFNLVLASYLIGRGARVTREVDRVFRSRSGRTVSGQIDFRTGGQNPTCIEFALRQKRPKAAKPGRAKKTLRGRPSLGGSLSAKTNDPEIRKLSRVPSGEARVRYLLLIDLRTAKSDALEREKLAAAYASEIKLSAGKFTREDVTVVYVHRERNFVFNWEAKPKA